MKIYLAGPMTGLSRREANDWRLLVSDRLRFCTILSPMRAKEFLNEEDSGELNQHPLTAPKGIVSRDFFDVGQADILIVNLLGAKRVSIGTMFEMAWAFQNKTPMVLIIESENIHRHPFPLEVANFTVATVEDAIDLVLRIV